MASSTMVESFVRLVLRGEIVLEAVFTVSLLRQ